MKGIIIRDLKGYVLAFDLADLLTIVGEPGRISFWRVSGVEATGVGAPLLHNISDANGSISGEKLFALASQITQTIDGDFQAFRDSDPNPWLIIRAVDSTEFDIETEDNSLLDALRLKYTDIVEISDFKEGV